MVFWGSADMHVFAKFLILKQFLRVSLNTRSAYMRVYMVMYCVCGITQIDKLSLPFSFNLI